MDTQRQRFSKYVRQLRERRGLTQEQLAHSLSVTKYQISHIENSNRGASRRVLEKLIQELKPTLKEEEDLKAICLEENIGIELPDALKGTIQAAKEMQRQGVFTEVFVVSARPIEITGINEENKGLQALVEELSNGTPSSNQKPKRYVYWTVESTLPRLRSFLDYLEKRCHISVKVLQDTFRFVVGPEELCLLSFAIYSAPVPADTGDEYERVGRVLIRNSELSNTFTIEKMGDADMRRAYGFLRDKLDDLDIHREKSPYRLLDVDDLKRYRT